MQYNGSLPSRSGSSQPSIGIWKDPGYSTRLGSPERPRRRLIWLLKVCKYIILIFILGLAGYFSIKLAAESHTTEYARILEEVTAGAVAALLISLLYDFFTKAEDEDLRREDIEDTLTGLSQQIFIASGILALPDSQLKDLVRELIAHDRFTQAIAEVTGEGRAFGAGAIIGLLRPLWRHEQAIELHSWENYFLKHPTDKDKYIWTSKQRVSHNLKNPKFRLALTDSATVEANLVTSGGFDSVIVLEKHDENAVNHYLDKANCKVRLHCYFSDHRENKELQGQLTKKEPEALPDSISEDEYARVSIIEFLFPPDVLNSDRCEIEWEHRTELSFSTPFCYIQSDRLYLTRDLVIDYRDIKEVLENEWAPSFIGNSGAYFSHDKDRGRIVAQIDGPLMPGQGIAVVWQRKYVAHASTT